MGELEHSDVPAAFFLLFIFIYKNLTKIKN